MDNLQSRDDDFRVHVRTTAAVQINEQAVTQSSGGVRAALMSASRTYSLGFPRLTLSPPAFPCLRGIRCGWAYLNVNNVRSCASTRSCCCCWKRLMEQQRRMIPLELLMKVQQRRIAWRRTEQELRKRLLERHAPATPFSTTQFPPPRHHEVLQTSIEFEIFSNTSTHLACWCNPIDRATPPGVMGRTSLSWSGVRRYW